MRTLTLAAICLLISGQALAQFTKLMDFGAQPEGINPYAPLATDGTFLYGVTSSGGAKGGGTIYKFDPVSAKVTVLYDLDKAPGDSQYGALLFDGGQLYGTALTGGANQQGFIYRIKTDGTGFTNIFDFNASLSGAFPYAGLITDGTVFYGNTAQGGGNGYGVIFQVNKDGTGYRKIYEGFSDAVGGFPKGKLVSDGTYLYGTTSQGGAPTYNGTVFKVKIDDGTFTTIFSFDGSNGSSSVSGLYYDGTFLWGVTQLGGASGDGVLFRMQTDGGGYTIYSNFNDGVAGYSPKSTLISDGTYLYGTTALGGALAGGAVFKIKLDGSGYSKVIDLTDGPFGQRPEGTLTLIGSTLYGTRSIGGHATRGQIFQVDTNGSNYKLPYSFQQNGNYPIGTFITDGDYLYGLTERGGEYDMGTLYRIKPDGSEFKYLIEFDGPVKGSRPVGGLLLIGSTLYGMTSDGGTVNKGTLFMVDTDGTDFTKLLEFDGATRGSSPAGSLIYTGGYLYGMTIFGGTSDRGAIFRMMPNGSNFSKLHDFTGGTQGSYPNGSLIVDGGALYGVTYSGDDVGDIFKIDPDGNNFQVLHGFSYLDAQYPIGPLYANGSYFYGVTVYGGDNNQGVVYKIQKDGTGFEKIVDLGNSDTGGSPGGSLISDGSSMYALMNYGGAALRGTILKIGFDGSYSRMTDFADGSGPRGNLYSDGTFLYGVTQYGGTNSVGTLFKRSLAPAVNIVDFRPRHGAAGTYVNIVGNDFDTDVSKNTVTFNGIQAQVLSAKSDSLVVLVPPGATDGTITVSAQGTSFNSLRGFDGTTNAQIDSVKVRTCDAIFTGPGSGAAHDIDMTFEPAVAGAKLTVDFTAMNIEDYLIVFDGPDVSMPIDTLDIDDNSFTYTATSAGGELTFRYWWQDETSDWTATIGCDLTNVPQLVIDSQPAAAEVCQNTQATFTTAASGPANITYQWQQSPDGNTWTDLSNGGDFSDVTTASLKIDAKITDAAQYRCRINGDGASEVTTNTATLTVNACNTNVEFVVYNAVSPNNDGKNEFFYLENIDVIPSKKENTVRIYNRWGDEVFSIANYNNNDRIFNGVNKNGHKLPSGIYFYKISFQGDDDVTGYLELKY